jgi:pimeloyl-ACP methyl ester carboxylesterase
VVLLARTRIDGPRGLPEFVLVHGLASNARMWGGVAAALAEEGFGSISVDLRGHGRSPKPDVADGYGFDVVIADLLELFADEGLREPVLVGQSWGGNVAIELAAAHPHAVAAVVAVDGGVIRLSDRFPAWDDCAENLAPPNLIGTPESRMRAWMTSAHPDWPASGIEGSMANFEVRSDGTLAPWLTRDRHLAVLRGLWEHNPVASFARLAVPATLLMADSGANWTADKAAGAAVCVEASPVPVTVEWFEGADHDLHAQHPKRTADSLIRAHTSSAATPRTTS